MFDIYLELKIDGSKFFNNKKNSRTGLGFGHGKRFSTDVVYVCGRSHQINDPNWYEDDDVLLVLLGDIYYRRANALSRERPLIADIVQSFMGHDLNRDVFQGNYWIVIFHKKSNDIRVFSDMLTTIPLYLHKNNSGIVLSNNLMNFADFNLPVNPRVALEIVLFNQPISYDTLIKDVSYFKPGTLYTLSKKGIDRTDKTALSDLVFNDKNDKLNILELIKDFNHAVLSLANTNNINLITLTGGYDSRSILSVLLKESLDVKAFSFGRKGGANTQVPLAVAGKLGITYEPYYLEEDYVEHYAKYADEAIAWSDGLSAFERANYLFVADRIRQESSSYLSGLVGGETFAPMTMYTTFCTRKYAELFYELKDLDVESLPQVLHVDRFLDISDSDVFKELQHTIQQYQNELKPFKKRNDSYLIVLYDFARNGFRNFYGGQIHTERTYIHNKAPFYSMDIFERIVFSSQKELFKNAFKGDAFSKRNNRLLQAKIIDSNYPELGRIDTDRGFAPKELLSLTGKLTSSIKYTYNSKIKPKRDPEFISNVWSALYYKYLLEENSESSGSIFNWDAIRHYMANYDSGAYSKQFNRLLSVARWTQMYDSQKKS